MTEHETIEIYKTYNEERGLRISDTHKTRETQENNAQHT